MWLLEANTLAGAADVPEGADWLRQMFKFPLAM